MAIVLYQISRPKVVVEVRETLTSRSHYLYIAPDQAIIFPSATFIRAVISKAGERSGQSRLPVVIDCLHINNTDFTAAKGFKAMLADFKSRDQDVYWLNPGPQVHHVLYSVTDRNALSVRISVDPVAGTSDSTVDSIRSNSAIILQPCLRPAQPPGHQRATCAGP